MADHPEKHNDDYWRSVLSPEQYYIAREKGTERPFSGRYDHEFPKGVYHCSSCDSPLFDSDHKFDSGCGWPAFSDTVEGSIEARRDLSHGMIRIEVTCRHCGAHLGHVFDDGPTPTGQRYCINSISLKLGEN